MTCLRCGKEVPEDQVFCPDCLAVMETCPVKPETVVHILQRPPRAPEKKYRTVSSQEQISQLRKTVKWLMLTVTVLTVALLLTAAMLLHRLQSPAGITGTPIGKNYTTIIQPK